MIVCPVCEHAQAAGAECEVCGKHLQHGPAATSDVPPVEGLEPTSHARADVSVERVAEIEPTRHREEPAVPGEVVPELEATAAAPVDAAVEPVPDLEPTAPELGEPRTPVPAFVTCRYCRTPAMPGERLCGHCGVRLPSFDRAPGAAAQPLRLCSCGTPVRSGPCPTCGARGG